MIHVMLTDFCNRACPFCFAKERLENEKQSELAISDLKRLIDLHRRWEQPVMSLVGGEPTLHSRFNEIIRIIMDSGCPVVHLFTNGLMAREKADFLATFPNVTYLVNYRPPASYSSTERELFDHFLATCIPNALYLSLGTTICSPDADLDFLLERTLQEGLTTVRIGLSHPIYYNRGEEVNQYLSTAQCAESAETVVTFAESCARQGVRVLFDCHFPLCMFSTEQLQRLRQACPDTPPPFSIECGQVTVRPDLRIFHCFATGSVFNDRRIDEFESAADLYGYFEERIGSYDNVPGYDGCAQCPMFRRHCSGGCVARRMLNADVLPEDMNGVGLES